jgi:hypothetical protein
VKLSFYDHHRQSYGHMPITEDRAVAEFMIGDYGAPGEDQGVDEGGEFAIHLYSLRADHLGREHYLTPCLRAFGDALGSLTEFIESGAWGLVARTGEERKIRSRDDLTALLLGAGLYDRSQNPVGHEPVCHCCGRRVDAAALHGRQRDA